MSQYKTKINRTDRGKLLNMGNMLPPQSTPKAPFSYNDPVDSNYTPLSEKSQDGNRHSDRNILPENAEVLAEKHFGKTARWTECGYLTTNGNLLDFSGRHWGGNNVGSREVDHIDIQEVFPDVSGYRQAQVDFVNSFSPHARG